MTDSERAILKNVIESRAMAWNFYSSDLSMMRAAKGLESKGFATVLHDTGMDMTSAQITAAGRAFYETIRVVKQPNRYLEHAIF